jgi:hypothetical protein
MGCDHNCCPWCKVHKILRTCILHLSVLSIDQLAAVI